MKTYAVKEIFHTLQGEGVHMGTPAVFVRFAGCNLWSGREEDRADAVCRFCDTDFVGGDRYTADQLVREIRAYRAPMVVFTGGEPGLQLDGALLGPLAGVRRAVETNGTIRLPRDLEWVCVSPKAGAKIEQRLANELKLVFPQPGLTPEEAAEMVTAQVRWLSPMDGPNWKENVAAAIDYAKANPRWRVNIQAHKFWSIQ